jgi:para-nitrobenzyl esterase
MAPTVKIAQGTLEGLQGDGFVAFLGIPYAAAPYGARRFAPPASPPHWEGTRNATQYGPTVLKRRYPPPFDKLLPDPQIPGEECLNLNVWTPEPGRTGLPVLVWIHGGSFAYGSNAVPDYDGGAFARDGVVCVAINYRLGVDGFALLEGALPNRGLLDQVAALEWVQGNISVFGGDPDRVTIAGESAGAMSVTTLLSMPRTEGLFARVVAQSGAGQHCLKAETAAKVTAELATRLGVSANARSLAEVPLDTLLDAQEALIADIAAIPDPRRWGEITVNALAFEPVIDGEILPSLPLDAIRHSGGATADLLIGTNKDENRLFLVPTGVIDLIDDGLLTLGAGMYGLPSTSVERYRAARPDQTPGDVLAAISTDWFFRIPALRVAEARQGAQGRTWVYEFTWPSPDFGGRFGSCHALEIPFVFDNLEASNNATLHSGGPQALADTMHDAWVRFATDGDPGWPAYDTGRRATMRFDLTSEVVDDPGGNERRLWDGLR